MGRKSIKYISIPVEVNQPNHLTAMKNEYQAHVKIVTNTDLKRWVFDSKPESRDRGTQIHDDTKIKLKQCLILK